MHLCLCVCGGMKMRTRQGVGNACPRVLISRGSYLTSAETCLSHVSLKPLEFVDS